MFIYKYGRVIGNVILGNHYEIRLSHLFSLHDFLIMLRRILEKLEWVQYIIPCFSEVVKIFVFLQVWSSF